MLAAKPHTSLPTISVLRAYEHNLKQLSLDIPRMALTVISGPSGSGKSTLAYDVIVAEANFRIERIHDLASSKINNNRQRPKVERISGLPYTIGLKQELPNPLTLRSHTLVSYLGLGPKLFKLFKQQGSVKCHNCLYTSKSLNQSEMIEKIMALAPFNNLTFAAILPADKISLDAFSSLGFSTLFIDGVETELDSKLNYQEASTVEVLIDSVPAKEASASRIFDAINTTCSFDGCRVAVYSSKLDRLVLAPNGLCEKCASVIPSIVPQQFALRATNRAEQDKSAWCDYVLCKPNLTLTQVLELELGELNSNQLAGLPDFTILKDLTELGLSHLSLNRNVSTLSSGELQRLRIARCISQISEHSLLVLDEPSSGLHPNDISALLSVFDKLIKNGSSLLVLEHDPQIINHAKHNFVLGPGAGSAGGELVVDNLTKTVHKRNCKQTSPKNSKTNHWLELDKISKHNLKNVSVRLPLGCFTVICGPSGSGKSTLLEVLAGQLKAKVRAAAHCLSGADSIVKVISSFNSQRPNSPFANVASYCGILELLREHYAKMPLSRMLGLNKKSFSLLSRSKDAARCQYCSGRGVISSCEKCHNTGYRNELADILFRGISLPKLLTLSIFEAQQYISVLPGLRTISDNFERLNLAHLILNQPLSTLSHGEFQRLRLLRYSAPLMTQKSYQQRDIDSAHSTIYLCDEPSRGLDSSEIETLISLFHDFCSEGHTVIAVEHNTKVISASDYKVELGPGAGHRGGEIVEQKFNLASNLLD